MLHTCVYSTQRLENVATAVPSGCFIIPPGLWLSNITVTSPPNPVGFHRLLISEKEMLKTQVPSKMPRPISYSEELHIPRRVKSGQIWKWETLQM